MHIHVHCRNMLLWNMHISKCGIWSLFANLVTDFNQMSPTRIRWGRGLKTHTQQWLAGEDDEWRLSEQCDVHAKCNWWTYIASMFKITTCHVWCVSILNASFQTNCCLLAQQVGCHEQKLSLSYALFSHDANRNGFWSLSVFLECASWTNLRVVHNTMSLSVAL